jgi:tetratricopeptide (TPR) repeat protein
MKLLPLLLCIAFVKIGVADEATVQFEQANMAYRDGEYQKAAELYEQIIAQGYESAPLYYNLGNVYFKLNSLPASILSYERAKRLAPNDEDINYNLRLANLRVVDKIEPLPQLFFIAWWEHLMNHHSADQWAIIAIIALWFAVLGGVLLVIGRALLRRIASAASVVALGLSVFAFIGVMQRNTIEEVKREAIVFDKSVSVKSAPDRQSTDLFVIHEGVKVELLDSVGEWRKIRLADGKVGWLIAESVESI